MQLSKKTLIELREIIIGNEKGNYRTGSQLVDFFNDLGFKDRYVQGFPSRHKYTDDRLQSINGKPELDKCIKNAFAVIDYVDNIDQLDMLIEEFNKYMAFDKWRVIRDNELILLKKLERVNIVQPKERMLSEEDEFMKRTFDINIAALGLDSVVTNIIISRIEEVEICVKNEAPLSAVVMIGSILEGILLGIASSYPKQFNQSKCAPKDDNGSVRKFQDWTLNNFIDVAAEVGFLKHDVKKFSHVVRDFRNYIHPYSQMNYQFTPDKHTVMICFQVLKAAIGQISEYRLNIQGQLQNS